MNSANTTAALIVAAGHGRRAGGDVPKQYQLLGGIPVLRRTVDAFLRHPQIGPVQVVIHPDYEAEAASALAALNVLPMVAGGKDRQDSVKNGLAALAKLTPVPDMVLIHDAARPLVSSTIINDVIDTVRRHQCGVLPALAVADTLKAAVNNKVEGTTPRDGLFQAQTPQGFPFAQIWAAHQTTAGAQYTDDTALFEALGKEVRIVNGDPDNFKITQPGDIARALTVLSPQPQQSRTGMGFDVHRFEAGDHVILCGHKIPFSKRLKGHSDADVALHALCDAIFGAACTGDIGTHFPPSDAQWRGAPSSVFLARAIETLAEAGGQLSHIDLTIICEAPKIGPHRAAMARALSGLTGLPEHAISVKATTTEGLGFTGRGEGIAAQAIVTTRGHFGASP